MFSLRTLMVVSLCALLTGCAAFAPPRPLVDEADVRATRGEPTAIWDNPDGTRTFEYSTQPFGVTAWMFTLDPGGQVIEQLDALSAVSRARVRPGLTVDEVRRMLGRERSIQRFSLSREEVWDWSIPNEWPAVMATRFNVHFIDGKVVRTSISEITSDRGWLFGYGVGRGRGPYWGTGWGWPHPFMGFHYW
ncbi:MAG TPA: hypothetical protein PLR02_13020 [Rhodocyclaceae bacterium]|nr:hypothetical protein [Rhodocyclaceae bacterium]